MVVPRLKAINCMAGEGSLLLGLDPRTRVEVADPTGQVRALLLLLREGTRTPAQLRAELRLEEDEIDDALAMLDGLGWLENAAAPSCLTGYERERYFSNLAFFDAFTTLSLDREEIQRRLVASHVVVLGAGGLGSSVIQNLAGLGVGRMTLLDQDTVELRNFARQFTYSEEHLGQPKVERVGAWLRSFDSHAAVAALHARIDGPDDVAALLDDASLVVAAIDEPADVDLWINEACVAAGVPFIRGGLAYMQGLYWSVDPGASACKRCLEQHRSRHALDADRRVVTWERVLASERVNRGIGPVAQLLGSLVAMEALRYLTAIAAPVSAGTYRLVDFAGACETSSDPWPRDPHCAVCASASRAGRQPAGTAGR